MPPARPLGKESSGQWNFSLLVEGRGGWWEGGGWELAVSDCGWTCQEEPGLSSQRTRSERLIRQLQTRDGIRPSAVVRQAGKGPRHGPPWSVEFTVFGLQSRREQPVCFHFPTRWRQRFLQL